MNNQFIFALPVELLGVPRRSEDSPIQSQYFKYQQKVNTPNGEGLIQGRTYEIIDGVLAYRWLVSHKKPKGEPGIWELQEYLPEQLTAVKD